MWWACPFHYSSAHTHPSITAFSPRNLTWTHKIKRDSGNKQIRDINHGIFTRNTNWISKSKRGSGNKQIRDINVFHQKHELDSRKIKSELNQINHKKNMLDRRREPGKREEMRCQGGRVHSFSCWEREFRKNEGC
jgi:hypothetical protein